MPERFTDELMRELIIQIDTRLREAERLRNQAEQQSRERPFWPERRRGRRDDDSGEPESSEPTRHR